MGATTIQGDVGLAKPHNKLDLDIGFILSSLLIASDDDLYSPVGHGQTLLQDTLVEGLSSCLASCPFIACTIVRVCITSAELMVDTSCVHDVWSYWTCCKCRLAQHISAINNHSAAVTDRHFCSSMLYLVYGGSCGSDERGPAVCHQPCAVVHIIISLVTVIQSTIDLLLEPPFIAVVASWILLEASTDSAVFHLGAHPCAYVSYEGRESTCNSTVLSVSLFPSVSSSVSCCAACASRAHCCA